MIVAGCDLGSQTVKVVIMDDMRLLAKTVIPATTQPEKVVEEALNLTLDQANLRMSDIQRFVATGYGQKQVSFATQTASEIVCHARGALWHLGSVRTIIDIGGQDAKAIKIDGQGKVLRYQYNDKCAAGTGRFLQIMADALEIQLDDMGKIAEKFTESITISNQCVVFAETEVVSLINDGKKVPDILNALHKALAARVASLVKGIGSIEQDVLMTGGVAKNRGVFHALEETLGVRIQQPEGMDPQINGAIGAALIAS
ncbi:MAG: 2-hydroxyglutaryl-CoA dehydratase [Desulfobacterales bacterium]|nr:2-hydroxyglutaryl-CoA dehydratase [Desulfobacterales bacterium]